MPSRRSRNTRTAGGVVLLVLTSLTSSTLTPGCAQEEARYRIAHDLVEENDEATMLLPGVSFLKEIQLVNGDWQFDAEGFIHLTRSAPFMNRMRFKPTYVREREGEISFRYTTRWARGDEHRLRIVFREESSGRSRQRLELLIDSAGQASVFRSELEDANEPVSIEKLSEATVPNSADASHLYRLEVASSRIQLFIDESPVLAAAIEEPSTPAPAEEWWTLELFRLGSGTHRTQTLLGHFVLPREEVLEAATTAPDRESSGARLVAKHLPAKRKADDAFLPENLRYSVNRQGKLGEAKKEDRFRSLVAPVGSAYRYRFQLSRGARLRSYFGFDTEHLNDSQKAALGVATFEVTVTSDGASRNLYSKTVSASEQRVAGLFELDLPLDVTGDMELELRVSRPARGKASIPTFWAIPRILEPVEGKVQPNVFFISVDTLRQDAIAPYDPRLEEATPTLFAFAQDAVTFTNAFSVSPWTAPSQFSLLSGLYPSRHGLNRAFGRNLAVAEDTAPTLAEILSRAGYLTAAIASDHSLDPDFGFDRGFHFFSDNQVRDVAPILPHFKSFVEQHRDEQLFLFFHSYDPHGPLFRGTDPNEKNAPEVGRLAGAVNYDTFLSIEDPTEEEKAHVRELYANHVRYYDRFFKEIIATLKGLELYESSLILFTSDHGEELFDRETYMHGHSLHDEVLQVPLLIKFPEGPERPATVDALTALIDVAPSLLDYLELGTALSFDGTSFMEVIEGRRKSHRSHFLAEALAWGPERKAVRSDRYKYIWTLSEEDAPQLEPRSNHYNSKFDTRPGAALYDLESDPEEQKDVSSEYPRLANRLRRLCEPLIRMRPVEGKPVETDADRLRALRSLGYIQE